MARREVPIGVKFRADGRELVGAVQVSERELKRLQQSLKDTGRASSNLGGSAAGLKQQFLGLKSVLVGLGAVAAAGLLTRFITQTVEADDKIGKLATRIGASTEALSEYQHVANLSGVSFQSLTAAWERMGKRAALAAQEMGPAKEAYRELGIDAQAFARLRPSEQFEILADALQGAGSASDKLRLASQLLGDEGRALIQTMDGGSAAIRAQRDAARDAGLTLTQLEADQAAKLNDRLTQMSARFQGTARSLVRDLIPAFERLTDWVISAVTELREMLQILGLISIEIEIASKGALQTELLIIGDQLTELANERARLERSGERPGFGRFGGVGDLINQQQELDRVNQEMAELNRRSSEIADILENMRSRGGVPGALGGTGAGGSSPGAAAADEIAQVTQAEIEHFQRLNESLALLNEMQAAEKARAEEAKTSARVVQRQVNETAEVWKNAARRIQNSFSDAFFRIFDEGLSGFRDLGDSILDVFKRVLAEMATLAIARPIIVPVVQALGGVLGVPGGALSGQLGGGGGGLFGAGSLFGGNSIGQSFSQGGAWLANNTGIGFGPSGNIFGSAGLVPNYGFGLASVGGGLVGSQFGGYGGLGGAAGANVGLALGAPFGPPGMALGALLGSVAGGALGGLFGGDDAPSAAQGALISGPGSYDAAYQSAFGQFGLRSGSYKVDPNRYNEVFGGLAQIENALASIADPGQIERITEAISEVGSRWEFEAIFARDRLDVITQELGGKWRELYDAVAEGGTTLAELRTLFEQVSEEALRVLEAREVERVQYLFQRGAGFPVGNDYNALLQSYQSNLPAEERVRRLRSNVGGLLGGLGTSLSGFDQGLSQLMGGDVVDLQLAGQWLRAAEKVRILREEEAKLTAAREAETEVIRRTEQAALAQRTTTAQGLLGQITGQFGQRAGALSAFSSTAGGLRSYLAGFGLGAESSLTPLEQLNLAAGQFSDLTSSARGLDQSAIAALPGAADIYRQLARDYYASSAPYQEIEQTIVSAIADVAQRSEDYIAAEQLSLERSIETLSREVVGSNIDGADSIVDSLHAVLDQLQAEAGTLRLDTTEQSALWRDILTELREIKRRNDQLNRLVQSQAGRAA